jgi:hypothetical protein
LLGQPEWGKREREKDKRDGRKQRRYKASSFHHPHGKILQGTEWAVHYHEVTPDIQCSVTV